MNWLRTAGVEDVALRKESVDRNRRYFLAYSWFFTSLSARRAWIEICCPCCSRWVLVVALRKESVDRNNNPGSTTLTFPGSLSARRAWIEIFSSFFIAQIKKSLSARRAWIEILSAQGHKNQTFVALRKESVDRNILLIILLIMLLSRSPQGERG